MKSNSPPTPASAAPNKLSYSAIRIYHECGRKYKFQYIEKVRELTKSSSLCFGVAFDKAIEAVLKDNTIDEKVVFDTWWEKQDVNKEVIDLAHSPLILYSTSDFDYDLFTKEDWATLDQKAKELFPNEVATWYQHFYACSDRRKAGTWSESEKKYYNYCSWLSLKRKGYLLLEANRKYILPRIKRVIAVQKSIEWKSGEGDILIGYADAIIEWEDGKIYVIDFKTASNFYADDAARTSSQLTIYSYALEIPLVGYFVFRKKINKNKKKICSGCGKDWSDRQYKTCPECKSALDITMAPACDVQIQLDSIPNATEELMLEEVQAANEGIKAGEFKHNYSSCYTKYGPCPFLQLCHKGKMDGLKKL